MSNLPCTNVKPPYLRPSRDDSFDNGRRQGITLFTCKWKKPRGVALKKRCGNAVPTPKKKEDRTK